MSHIVKNLQRKVKFDLSRLRKDVTILTKLFKVERFDLGVVCVGEKKIQHLNSIYRGYNMPTDVLSFPYHEDVIPGTIPEPIIPCDWNIGDLYLGIPVIQQHCTLDSTLLDNRLPVLITHGICHLLGYTHDNMDSWHKMHSKELSILQAFSEVRELDVCLEPLTPSPSDTHTS